MTTEEMTKEQLVDAIYDLEPSYRKLKIDLTTYTIEQLRFHYNRKKDKPFLKERRKNWYTSITPSPRRSEVIEEDTYEVPVTKEKEDAISLTGFDALDKERTKQ
jgi:hypothetical protein